ncbi:hypothetical protein RN001_011243 [Aquatica leii]|uniref:Uncharacterized protein n=1 Tax=Aquatica leii TaxID=1421715 RepID=A0AAN7PXK8_9COLE|nr:hypothetical protein RN001_011243 [Aquatica leii]
MIKVAVFVVATLAVQGVIGAATRYDDDFTFINFWNEIELEIKDVVLRLKNDADDDGYLRTVSAQCKKLAQVVERVIDQLHQETIDHEQGDIIFKRVTYIFQQVHSSLNDAYLYPENSTPTQLKSKLIYNLELVMEHMEQLVFIAKTYCPQLRALLRTILVDFQEFARGFYTENGILEKDVVIYESPKRMVAQINVITKQFTDLLKECNHMEEMRMVLRGYIRYVEEIIHKLEDKPIGDERINVVVQRLVDELRQMFVPLMKMIMNEERIEVKIFKSKLIERFLSINMVFDQLVDLIESESCPIDVKEFLERIIYFYYYTIKQTHFEVRTAYKNTFYGGNYHEEFFGSNQDEEIKKHLGVFDEDFEIETPEELVMRIQKLVQRFNTKSWDTKPVSYYVRDFVQVLEYVADKIAKEVRIGRLAYTENIMNTFYTDLKKMKIELEDKPSRDEFVRYVQKMFVDLYKIVIVEKMQDNGYEHLLLKDICIKFYNFLNDVFYKMDVSEHLEAKVDEHQRKPRFVFIKIVKY